MKIKNKKDFGLGIFGILFSAWIVWYSTSFLGEARYEGDPGPKLFPIIGAVIMFICSVVILIKPDPASKQFLSKKQWLAAGKIFLLYCLTALLYYLIGFTATVPIMLFILTFVLSKASKPDWTLKKRIISSLIFAIIAGAVIYAAYILGLQARLPKGILFK